MGYSITMFIMNLLIPVIMIVGGYFMYKKPPKEINGVCGYRTPMSTKNKETWNFANKACGKIWFKTGIPTLLISVIAQIPFLKADNDTFGKLTTLTETVQIAILLLSIFCVEKKLRDNFDKDGNKIE